LLIESSWPLQGDHLTLEKTLKAFT
jgi:hypothetical protein